MRILVCGGRDYGHTQEERAKIYGTLDKICLEHGAVTNKPEDREDGNWLPTAHIIAGGARGVDTVAIDWAVINWTQFTEFPVDWKTHGRRAGYIRNKQMLDEGKPDLVVAFPGGKGTAMMIKLARYANVPVIEIAA